MTPSERLRAVSRSRWLWIVVVTLFVLAAPAASFLSNQRLRRPAGPPRPAEKTFAELSFGAPVTFEPSFTLPILDAEQAPTGADTLDASAKSEAGSPRSPLTLDVVTSDAKGRVWVVDHPAASAPRARVRVFDARGRRIAAFTTPLGATLFMPGAHDDLWLDLPAGAAGREVVQRYSTTGKLLGEYPLPKGYLARFLRLDPDGGVYAYQEQWSIDSATERNRFAGTLLPVAHGPRYEAVRDPKTFDAAFFGADGHLYVAQSSFAYRSSSGATFSVRSVARDGSPVASYRLPKGAVPVGADREGRVYAEVPPSGMNEQRGHAILGEVQDEDTTVFVVGRDGSTSRFFAKRPPWIGGWPSTVWVDPAGRVGALSFGADGVTVGRLILGERPARAARPPRFSPQLRLITDAEPRAGDPYAARDAVERDVMQLVYSGLVSLDDRLRSRPALAEAVPSQGNGGVARDGLTISYTMKRGVRWHDGEPVTGKDVVATWRYLRERRVEARAEPFAGFDRIRDVEARGRVVRVRLREPYGAGPAAFFPYVLPSHLLASSGGSSTSPLWARPVGSGPYRLQRWLAGRSWELVAHDRGPSPTPKVRRLEVRFSRGDAALGEFQSADVPTVWTWVGAAEADAVKRDKVGTVSTAETGRWRGVLLGPSAMDAEARAALVLAYPRKAMARDVLPASTVTDAVDLFPRASASHDPGATPPSSDDTRAAAAILGADGWRPGKEGLVSRGGDRLEVPFAVGRRSSGDEASFESVVAVADTWRSMGALAYRSMSTPHVYEAWHDGGFLSGGSYRAAYGIYQGTPDPGWGGVFDPSEAPGPTRPRGLGVAASAELSRLYAEARSTYDAAERAAIGRRISRVVRERSLCIFERYETRDVAVLGVRGLEPAPYPAGDLWNVAQWRVER